MNRITLALSVYVTSIALAPALELNSEVRNHDTGEGIRTFLEFRDRDGMVHVSPPERWLVSGGGAELRFTDPQNPQTGNTLVVSSVPTGQADGDRLQGAEESYKRLAFGQVPAEAEEVTCIRMDRTGPMIRNSFGVMYEYRYKHQTRWMQVLVVIWNLDPLGQEKLLLVTREPAAGRREEISPCAKKLLGALYTWTNVPSGATR